MTALNEFFTFPWIKILLQDYFYSLGNKESNGDENRRFITKSFRAYVREVYDGGSYLILNDGFNEI